jgi:Fe-S-cluster containining protein
MPSEFVKLSRVRKTSENEFYPIINRMYEALWQQLLPPQIPTDGLSSKVEKNVITPPDAPIPDCLTCGACCQSLLCVGVRPSDNVHPDLVWDITAEANDGEIVVDRYLRRNGETLACVALEGTVGEKVACSIYDTRPVMCHHFDAGSDRCHAIRRAFGIEPFLSLQEMSDAMKKLKTQDNAAEPWNVIRTAEIRPDAETGEFVIDANMRDGNIKEIHRYDPDKETWMQFEFDGLTSSQAAKLINIRQEPI